MAVQADAVKSKVQRVVKPLESGKYDHNRGELITCVDEHIEIQGKIAALEAKRIEDDTTLDTLSEEGFVDDNDEAKVKARALRQEMGDNALQIRAYNKRLRRLEADIAKRAEKTDESWRYQIRNRLVRAKHEAAYVETQAAIAIDRLADLLILLNIVTQVSFQDNKRLGQEQDPDYRNVLHRIRNRLGNVLQFHGFEPAYSYSEGTADLRKALEARRASFSIMSDAEAMEHEANRRADMKEILNRINLNNDNPQEGETND